VNGNEGGDALEALQVTEALHPFVPLQVQLADPHCAGKAVLLAVPFPHCVSLQ
jgi:hypothetical protein